MMTTVYYTRSVARADRIARAVNIFNGMAVDVVQAMEAACGDHMATYFKTVGGGDTVIGEDLVVGIVLVWLTDIVASAHHTNQPIDLVVACNALADALPTPPDNIAETFYLAVSSVFEFYPVA